MGEEGVSLLLAALAAHDPYLLGHAWRVSRYSAHVGGEVGLGPDRRRLLTEAALLHDIGKTALPAEVLLSPRSLSEAEYSLVQRHSELGAEILADAGLDRHAEIVLNHHEHWDGGGYPAGAGGTEVPLEARIILVADAFDAMTSQRAYVAPRSPAQALAEIDRCAGGQFDPTCALAMRSLAARGVLGDGPAVGARA